MFVNACSILRSLTALVLLALLSPFMLIAILCVLIFDGYPVFFVSKRIGQNKKPFWMIKLRTMRLEGGEEGVMTVDAHPRITELGKWLRRLKIDEIPQLWNIVLFEMAFFGPRPDVFTARHLYAVQDDLFFKLLPGLLDLSSLIFAHEGKILALSKNSKDAYSWECVFNAKKKMIAFYVEKKTLKMDVFLGLLLVVRFFSARTFIRGLSLFYRAFDVPLELQKLCSFYAKV